LIWTDGVIRDQWLEVTVRSDGSINIEADDVFYFANLVGDCDGDGEVGSSDYAELLSEFGRSGDNLATDFNTDGVVGPEDFTVMRARYGNALVDPPVLAGDADGNGVVGAGDFEILRRQLGLAASGLSADFNGNGRVGLDDFVILRGNFGNVLDASAPLFAPETPSTTAMAESQADTEPIAGAYAPVAPVVSQPVDDNDSDDGSIVSLISAPAIDLLVESLAPGSYISASHPRSEPSGQLAATAEYDLRPLSDDLGLGEADDLMTDILAESELMLRL
jgi:hypothetical protein